MRSGRLPELALSDSEQGAAHEVSGLRLGEQLHPLTSCAPLQGDRLHGIALCLQQFSLPLLLTGIAFVLSSIGLSWGLPSAEVDRYLFGDQIRWSGDRVLALAPSWSSDLPRGADVAAHPIADRTQTISLNADDTARAAIVRRYRLYSAQPDEMITLRALAQMQPGRGRFDPKLYQYGGLWIYPIGALLKITSLLHVVIVTSDLSFYLDHPEQFGRLYVVMRGYSVAWGLVGVATIFWFVKRQTRRLSAAVTAAICFSLLPTVLNGAHEAKPHLAGAVLILLSLSAAVLAVETKQRRWILATGIAVGAAASMVLSAVGSVGLLPVMALFLPAKRFSAFILSITAAAVTFAICNPYLIVHLFGDRTVLQSNLENSAAMYQVPASIGGAIHGLRLLLDSGSMVIFFGLFVLGLLFRRLTIIACLIFAVILPMTAVFFWHANGKSGEYARFAMPVDVLLIVAAAMGVAVFRRSWQQWLVGGTLCLMLLPIGISYVWHYGRETFDRSTRLIGADRLRDLQSTGARTLAIDAEPAPYDLPPPDLFRWKIVLLPRDSAFPTGADVRLDPVDEAGDSTATIRYWIRPRLLATPISWAAKPFRVETHQSSDDAAAGAKDRRR